MGKFLEDFVPGEEIVTGGRTITEEAILAFAALYDPQSFHIDVPAATASTFGGLISSGFQTLAIGFRLFLDTGTIAESSLGSPGMDELRWPQPVRPNDTIRTIARIISVRPSKSKPDRGIVTMAIRVINQREEDVMTLSTTVFVLRRPQ